MQTIIGIKFKDGGKVYSFSTNGLTLKENEKVVVETSRGKEIGIVVGSEKQLDKNEQIENLQNVVRIATKEDLQKMEDLNKRYDEVKNVTNDLINKFNLNMKLVDIEFTLDDNKVIISFVCEDRVDFRDLVKELANKLKLRIELKQIGIRDQAKIVGAIGACGQVTCCKRYLCEFDKVSIKMAKNQGLSLNPTKISGVCGRLMCCLAYENEHYAETLSKMPKLNSCVITPDGKGLVQYNDVLSEKVTVKVGENENVKLNVYNLSDVKFEVPALKREKQEDVNAKEIKEETVIEKFEENAENLNTKTNKKSEDKKSKKKFKKKKK